MSGSSVTFTTKKIEHLVIPISDDDLSTITNHFEPMHQFIKKNLKRTNVLVHCFAGTSQSATVVISFLMKEKSLSLKQAYKFVLMRRSQIRPNKGFLAQLKSFDGKNYNPFSFVPENAPLVDPLDKGTLEMKGKLMEIIKKSKARENQTKPKQEPQNNGF